MNPQLYTFFLSIGLLDTTIIKGTILLVLRDLIPFIQFKKHEKYPWRGVTFSKLQASSLLKVTPFYGYFSRFVNCANGTKSCKTSHVSVHFSRI